jgi:hypothetical protein
MRRANVAVVSIVVQSIILWRTLLLLLLLQLLFQLGRDSVVGAESNPPATSAPSSSSSTSSASTTSSFSFTTTKQNSDNKSRRICSVQSGLELTRLTSIETRTIFQGAMEDIELLREYVTESMTHGGDDLANGFPFQTLNDLAATLDWQARGYSTPQTTIQAGLGYVNDQKDRRVDLYISLMNKPKVGNKEADLLLVQTVSNLLPWIVDRKSVERLWWWTDHQNGRSEGASKQEFQFAQLYTAAWINTYGEATVLYPPFSLVIGHPSNLGDVLGPRDDTDEAPYILPNLPENDPHRVAKFSAPYPDGVFAGLSMITAMAPVYYTGTWHNFTYTDQYVATVGIDIKIEAIASLVQSLEGTLTKGSFAFLVDTAFHMIVISPDTVGMIYPLRTGMEDSRVTYDAVDGSIVADRRNQTYLPSDTIFQDLNTLTNADWNSLQSSIMDLLPGEKGYDQLNVTLTGQSDPTLFYVMYERWSSVDDFVLVALAPVIEVERAIHVRFLEPDFVNVQFTNRRGKKQQQEDDDTRHTVTFVNEGTLDVWVSLVDLPPWLELVEASLLVVSRPVVVTAGDVLDIEFDILVDQLEPGTSNKLVRLYVEDADYPDCTFSRDMGFEVTVELQSTWLDKIGVSQALILAAAIIFIIVLLVLLYFQKKYNRDDSVWKVQKKDLLFHDPPDIIGRGTFGLILKAEYRGTQVAVKRIMPPKTTPTTTDTDVMVSEFRSGEGNGMKSGYGGAKSGIYDPNKATISVSWGSKSFGSKRLSQGAQWKKRRSDFIEEMRYISKLRHPCVTTVMGTSFHHTHIGILASFVTICLGF